MNLSIVVKSVLLFGVCWGLGACAVSEWEIKPGKRATGRARIITPDSLAVVGPIEEVDAEDEKGATQARSPMEAAETTVEIKDETNKDAPVVLKPDLPVSEVKSLEKPTARLPPKVTSKVTSKVTTATSKETPKVATKSTTKKTFKATPATILEEAERTTKLRTKNAVSAAPVQKASHQSEASLVHKTVAKQPISSEKLRPTLTRVKGKVTILGVDNKTLKASGVILTLKPLDGQVFPKTVSPVTHVIDMKNKSYKPGLMTINKNDRLSFVNRDKIKHNVFSSTGKNAFDLGTYGSGKKRQVSLNVEGIVKVYCNIHSEMATFVAVDDNAKSTIADESGGYEIKNVPSGKYRLSVWNVRGETAQNIEVENKPELNVDVTLNTSNFSGVEHKNKFGKKYNKNASFFNDEFY